MPVVFAHKLHFAIHILWFPYRQFQETLKNQNEEKAILQAKLLKMQTVACNSKCDKIPAVEKTPRDEYKKYNFKVVAIETECTSNSNNNETLEIEKDNDCAVTATVSKLKLRNTD